MHFSRALAVSCAFVHGSLSAQPFTETTIDRPGARHEAGHAVHLAGQDQPHLMLVTRDGDALGSDRVFRLIPIDGPTLPAQDRDAVVPAPDGALFYDIAESTDDSDAIRHVLVALSADTVWRLDAERRRWKPVADVPTLYRSQRNRDFGRLAMAEDLDGDGTDELLVPTFAGYRVVTLGDDVQREPVDVPAPVAMRLSGPHPRFQRYAVWPMDTDLDGHKELVILRDNRFRVHAADGSNTSPGELATPVTLRDGFAGDTFDLDDESDQSDLTIHQLYRVDDINGDGFADLVTRETTSRGVFDKSTTIKIFRGRRVDGRLGFADEPDQTIHADGIQFDARLDDVDGDGHMELALPMLKLGIMKIVGALLSGNTDYALNIYRLDVEPTDEPAYSRDVKMAFDLGSGYTHFPALRTADFTGAGRKGLVVQTDDDELTLFHAADDGDLFSGRGESFHVVLPADGSKMTTGDVDGDGHADLIIRYGPADPGAEQTRIRVLFARPAD